MLSDEFLVCGLYIVSEYTINTCGAGTVYTVFIGIDVVLTADGGLSL